MPYRTYRVQSMETDMTENPDMMPEMMIPATTGKILICHCYDYRRTAGLSWAGIDAALDRFEFVKDASLK